MVYADVDKTQINEEPTLRACADRVLLGGIFFSL